MRAMTRVAEEGTWFYPTLIVLAVVVMVYNARHRTDHTIVWSHSGRTTVFHSSDAPVLGDASLRFTDRTTGHTHIVIGGEFDIRRDNTKE